MIHTIGQERLPIEKILTFLGEADHTFPVPLSDKTDLEQFANKLHKFATLCTLEEDEKIIAMVAGYTENTTGNAAYVTLAATLPAYRGRGYAKQLLMEFINRAEAKRLKSVHLYAVKDNIAAMKLYDSLGFVEWHLENEDRPEDVHLIRYLKHKTALVTAIGSYSADIVIKKLKNNGFRVVGTDIYAREWIADAYNVNEFYQVPYVREEEDYLQAITNICDTESITHILPSSDIEVDFFSKYRELFEKKNIIVCLSPYATLRICRDKYQQFKYISENVPSVQVIPTMLVSEASEPPFAFPMICKPLDGRSSQGLRIVETIEDWLAVKACADMERYIAQPKIRGRVVTVDVIRDRTGGTVVALPRMELLRTRNGAGLSVKVYPDEVVENASIDLANALGIVGCVNFEFIHSDDGSYHYIECNPRFSGGVEFSCMAGYDCISNHIRCFDNKEIDRFKLSRTTYIARKFEEYITKVE